MKTKLEKIRDEIISYERYLYFVRRDLVADPDDNFLRGLLFADEARRDDAVADYAAAADEEGITPPPIYPHCIFAR